MFRKLLLVTLVFLGLITFAQSESSWIKKKDKSEKIEKTEKKKTSNWIKKKIKDNKKEYKKEEKKITKEVKSWIKKKSKDEYIASIKDLPKGAIYFQASNESRSSLIYGYVFPDTQSKLINGFYETSKGLGFFNDGKTTCKVGSTVRFVSSSGEVISQVSGECTNGIKFTGTTSQEGNSGWGSAKTADGKERFFFDFNITKTEIAKLYKRNETMQNFAAATEPSENLELNPTGKYYALLIGNSNYTNWASLTSPVNDINEIGKLLRNKYNFEEVIILPNANREKIFESFEKLSEMTTDSDYVLVYYAGHGETKGSKSYWIPKNAKKKYSSNWINIADIENYLEEIPAHHLAIMVDSCYFTGFKGSNTITEKKSKHYKKLIRKRARLVLASGQNEPVSDTGKGNHSVFASTFIQALRNNDNAISMGEIGMNIGYAHSHMNQMPIYAVYNHWGHSGGDFIFIAKK